MDIKKVITLFRNIMENHFGFPPDNDRDYSLWAEPTVGFDDYGYFMKVADITIPFEYSEERIRLPEVVESEEDILPYISPYFVNRLRREYRDQLMFNRELWEHEDMMTEEELQQKDSDEYIHRYTSMGVPVHLL